MSDVQLPNHFELRTEYVGDMTDNLKTDLDKIAHKHIDNMSSSYLKKYIEKSDAEVHFHVRMEKLSDGRYELKFNALLDWNKFYWDTDVPFKEPYDAMNHAFKHLKEHLAQK